MRKYVTEFIGTFGLVFTVGCAVMGKAALARWRSARHSWCSSISGGHTSGGHYNPAVSLAAYLRGWLSREDLGPCWLAQAAGALVAAGLATFVVNPAPFPALDMSGRAIGAGLVAEFSFTFALAYVVLNVATSKDHPGNSFYGLAIGFTVFTGATAVGRISGGAFNPAVALGASVMGGGGRPRHARQRRGRGRGVKRSGQTWGHGLCSDLLRTAGPVVLVRPGWRAAGRGVPGLRRPG
jgi:aquaporin Z